MDQCTRCSCHGDVEACETTQCTYHDLWYVKHLRARIAALKQAESGGSAATNSAMVPCPRCGYDDCVERSPEFYCVKCDWHFNAQHQ